MISVIGDLVVDILVSSGASHYATDTEANIQTIPGGQANNVAAWINESGSECTLIGRIGEDPYGGFLLENLDQLGVKASIETDGEVETGKIAILIDPETGERTMYTDRGANKYMSHEQIEKARDAIKQSDCLYVSGYSLFEESTYQAVLYAKKIAQEHHVPIAFDPSSTYFLEKYHERVREFLNGVDFFFPNLDEGRLLSQQTKPENMMDALSAYVNHPILKMGVDGCLIHENNQLQHIPAEKVRAIDTTGAGDSFIGAFLAAFFQHHNIKKSAIKATHTASKAVMQTGGRP